MGNLAAVVTPMHAHCREIKRRDPDTFTVFIGPCVAKKREADEADAVDACLTFDEVRQWMDAEGVAVRPGAPGEGAGKRARFYPTAGGILKSMNDIPGYTRVAIDGAENCKSALAEIRGGEMKNAFVEMSACEGSCINGPIMREHQKRRVAGVLSVSRSAGPDDFDIEGHAPLAVRHEPSGIRRVLPGNEAVQEVLNRDGQTDARQGTQLRLLRVSHLPGKGDRRVPGQGGHRHVPAVSQGKGGIVLR